MPQPKMLQSRFVILLLWWQIPHNSRNISELQLMENHSWRVWLTAGVLLVVACLTVPRIWSGPSRAAALNAERTMVFVCRESGVVYTGIPQAVPAVNPATGEETLMPGWYCPRCNKWYAGPDLETAQRSRRPPLCEVCRQPLLLEGPPPALAATLPLTE